MNVVSEWPEWSSHYKAVKLKMKSLEKYSENIDALLKQIANIGGGEQINEFTEKYKTWSAFFDQIISTSSDANFPKIYSLVATTKIVILCGLAESLGSGASEIEKIRNFLSLLSIEEKLLFSLMFNVKKTDVQAQQLYEEMLKTGKDNTSQLLTSWQNTQDIYRDEVRAVMNSFIKDEVKPIEDFFISRVNFLYGIRSAIVHKGTPNLISSMHLSRGETIMYMGGRDNKFFSIRYPIEEFFLRAGIRLIGHEPIKPSLSDFLWDEFISEHAFLVARISNKIKGL